MTFYNQEGVTVTRDEDGVSIYIEGVHRCTMTEQEFSAIVVAFLNMGVV